MDNKLPSVGLILAFLLLFFCVCIGMHWSILAETVDIKKKATISAGVVSEATKRAHTKMEYMRRSKPHGCPCCDRAWDAEYP